MRKQERKRVKEKMRRKQRGGEDRRNQEMIQKGKTLLEESNSRSAEEGK